MRECEDIISGGLFIQLIGLIKDNKNAQLKKLLTELPIHLKKLGLSLNLDVCDFTNIDKKTYHVTLLMYAIAIDNQGAIDILINAGANINQANHRGNTALHFAAYFGDIKITEKLINENAIFSKNSNEQTPLNYAQNAKNHNVEIYLKENHTQTQNYKASSIFKQKKATNMMSSSLYLALFKYLQSNSSASKELKALFDLLTQCQIQFDLNVCPGWQRVSKTVPMGLSLLMLAVYTNNESMLAALLQLGANPDITDIRGKTALHYAVERRHHNLALLLLKTGANPNIADKTSNATPLYYAAKHNDEQMVAILIRNYGEFLPTNPNLEAKQYDYIQGTQDITSTSPLEITTHNTIKELLKTYQAIIKSSLGFFQSPSFLNTAFILNKLRKLNAHATQQIKTISHQDTPVSYQIALKEVSEISQNHSHTTYFPPLKMLIILSIYHENGKNQKLMEGVEQVKGCKPYPNLLSSQYRWLSWISSDPGITFDTVQTADDKSINLMKTYT